MLRCVWLYDHFALDLSSPQANTEDRRMVSHRYIRPLVREQQRLDDFVRNTVMSDNESQ